MRFSIGRDRVLLTLMSKSVPGPSSSAISALSLAWLLEPEQSIHSLPFSDPPEYLLSPSMSDVAHGKRHRDAEEPYGNIPVVDVMPLHERVRAGPCNGMGARTCSKPENTAPYSENNNTSRARSGGSRPQVRRNDIIPFLDLVGR